MNDSVWDTENMTPMLLLTGAKKNLNTELQRTLKIATSDSDFNHSVL